MTDPHDADDARVRVAPTDHSDPAVGFVVESDGDVRATAANEAFLALAPNGTTPDSAHADEPLAGTLETWLTDTDGQAVTEALVAGDALPETVQFEAESERRRLCRVGPTGNGGGHLLFVESPDPAEAPASVAPEALAQAVSHDLRNPLDVARAHLQASMDAHPDDDHLETVLASHDRMEQIIDDVLTLARGERALEPETDIDLTAVLTDAWDSVSTADASLCVTEELPTTAADRRRMERLFENLLRNSVEHGSTDDDTAAADLTVTAGPLDADAGFYVADDGVGVPADERAAVFTAGYSSTDQGTGLGLAIVERIAVAHGWAVSLTESASGGARVDVRFTTEEGSDA